MRDSSERGQRSMRQFRHVREPPARRPEAQRIHRQHDDRNCRPSRPFLTPVDDPHDQPDANGCEHCRKNCQSNVNAQERGNNQGVYSDVRDQSKECYRYDDTGAYYCIGYLSVFVHARDYIRSGVGGANTRCDWDSLGRPLSVCFQFLVPPMICEPRLEKSRGFAFGKPLPTAKLRRRPSPTVGRRQQAQWMAPSRSSRVRAGTTAYSWDDSV